MAARIRDIAFGWMGWSVAAALILFSGGVFLFTDNAAPLVLSLVCIFFAIHIVSLFLAECLENAVTPSANTPVDELLSSEILRQMPRIPTSAHQPF